jgi:hypothetical protein
MSLEAKRGGLWREDFHGQFFATDLDLWSREAGRSLPGAYLAAKGFQVVGWISMMKSPVVNEDGLQY